MNKPRIDHNGAAEPGNRSAIGGPQDIFYANSNIVPLPIIERAEGIYMWDEEGNEYIDASSGPVVSNIGHGNRHVAETSVDPGADASLGGMAAMRSGEISFA